jgi:short-subunit dehydrogenase
VRAARRRFLLRFALAYLPGMPTALVTGASSGIGLELASLAARDRHDVVLVARRRDRLESIGRGLTEEYGVRATILAQDLADPSAPEALAREISERGIAVDVLVNNAGFGLWGFFAETTLARSLEMIQVNVAALTALTRLFLPGMIARRSGRILNVASTAAFQPGPLMAVYYATKAYVLSFSEALASETARAGVTVTALCPGPTPTGFQENAGIGPVPLLTPALLTKTTDVARAGWDGMNRGKRIVIPGLTNRILVQSERLAPRRLVTAITRRLQESRR